MTKKLVITMVTEEELLDFMREKAYKPMTYQELETHFQMQDANEFRLFLKMLNQMEEEGTVLRTRGERYGIPERMNLLRGRLQAHPKGFGFLIPEDKEHPDVYIHANDLHGAMNKDTILVRVQPESVGGSGRMEGEVVRIVKRFYTQVVGRFEDHESYAFVIADDKRISKDLFIPKDHFGGAVDGMKVVVEIMHYPEGRSAAEGKVIEVLGHKDDPGVDILSVIRKFMLPESFPDQVMAEAEAVPNEIGESDRIGRRDLRGKPMVTIDGEDAKDLDDAVSVERLPNGNVLLGVHIADVGYYVKENSELDKEAYRRGCSVYLVDRVIPMLPHRLSNGICSLNPQVDRLTMSCEMEFDAQANVVKHDIFTSVIKTTERMTYTNVRKILKNEDPELNKRYADLVDQFHLMEELALKLRHKRMQRGAIDFDFKESKIIMNKEGAPVDIVLRERSIAEQIIEEFMLAANETVAEHFHWLHVPFLYRIHEDPDAERMQHFLEFITNFGYMVRGRSNSVHPRALQKLIEEIKDTKEETVINTVLLRSMKQARYDAESLGHFGLAAEYYSHFTSPIRRYPDLVIHRVMREVFEHGGSLPAKRNEHLTERMPDIAEQSSDRERVAVDAERETDALKKAEFMLDKVGEEFDGIISSVTSFGMFVELDNTVEGLIRLSDLSDDYYHFHEKQHTLIGERTSKIYRIGDEVKVRVVRVNMNDHTIDFELLNMKQRNKPVSLVDMKLKGQALKDKSRRKGKGGGRGRNGRGGRSGSKSAGQPVIVAKEKREKGRSEQPENGTAEGRGRTGRGRGRGRTSAGGGNSDRAEMSKQNGGTGTADAGNGGEPPQQTGSGSGSDDNGSGSWSSSPNPKKPKRNRNAGKNRGKGKKKKSKSSKNKPKS